MNLEEKQRIEIEFWRDSKTESPESQSIENILNKMGEAEVLLDCLSRFKNQISPRGRVLELGGGQGWASCLYKRLYPEACVITTDISEYAIQSLPKWEHIWEVKLDGAYACKSYETKEADSSVDIVFCFAAAHHFIAHDQTFLEIHRILKPGGKAFYFYEPACEKFFYPRMYKKVNQVRPDVPEDVLIVGEIKQAAEKHHLSAEAHYYPNFFRRGLAGVLYYTILKRFLFLAKILPCTTNFLFVKRAS